MTYGVESGSLLKDWIYGREGRPWGGNGSIWGFIWGNGGAIIDSGGGIIGGCGGCIKFRRFASGCIGGIWFCICCSGFGIKLWFWWEGPSLYNPDCILGGKENSIPPGGGWVFWAFWSRYTIPWKFGFGALLWKLARAAESKSFLTMEKGLGNGICIGIGPPIPELPISICCPPILARRCAFSAGFLKGPCCPIPLNS